MSSMAETCIRELFSYCKILKKSHLRQKFTHQKKYKNSEKITKKNVLYRFLIWIPIILLCLIIYVQKMIRMDLEKTKKIKIISKAL